MTIQVDILAVFAHPDDLELSVGGTMLKLKSLGYKTGALDVTRGEMGTRGTVEGRAKESENAAKILKLDVRENLGLPDGHVFANDESRRELVRALRRLKPSLVFTHQIDDSHPDHDHIAQMVRECSRLAAMKNYDFDTGEEKIRPPIVAHTVFSRNVVPSFVVDVTQFHEQKMDALRAHASQFYRSDSTEPETMLTDKRFLDDIASRSRYFGTLIGVEYGEPFHVREALNVDDPFALLTRPMNLYS